MKILFVSGTLSSGGKERRLTELMKSLKHEKNIEYELVLMSNDIHYKEVFELGIKIHYIIRKTKKDILVFNRFYNLCRSYKPNIVHCWDSMTSIYLAPICKLLQIKLVNGMVSNSPARRNIFNKHWLRARLTFPFSDFIVGNSKSGLKAYHAPENKSMVIYNGFNFERIKNLEDKEVIRMKIYDNSKYLIGMVATFCEQKDYKTFFRAAQILLKKRDDITFLAIGRGTNSEEAIKLIDKAYMDSFRLIGLIPDVESYINVMDVCVLSTFTEGISNSILEYMALGKPVVATDGGGTEEIVINNETGFLVKQSDPFELAAKMEIFLNDPHLRKSFGQEGKDRVKWLFSIETMVNNYVELYNKIVKN